MAKGTRCCHDAVSANAARFWDEPAGILRKPSVERLLENSHNARILEIGAGCLRNALFLLDYDLEVHVLDPPVVANERFSKQYRKFRRLGGLIAKAIARRPLYDIVLTTYVIETICSVRTRCALVRSIASCLKAKGYWLLSVRGPRNIVLGRGKYAKCSDGYLTSQRTFVRSYTVSQLRSFLRRNGFRTVNSLHKPWNKAPELLDVVARKC